MQTEIVQESPLVGVQGLLASVPSHLHAQVRIEEMPFLELNNIRGNSASPEFVQAIGETLDVALPIKANTVSIGTEYVLWWLGPNEWLAQSAQARPAVLEAGLRGRFGDQFATSVDVSSGIETNKQKDTAKIRAFIQNAAGFIHIRRQRARRVKPRPVVHHDHGLAELLAVGHRGHGRLGRRHGRHDDLEQRHLVHRREEVHA